jgi:hypothetical protein
MPDNSVMITNVESGETITLSYTLDIECVVQQVAMLYVTDTKGAQISNSPQLVLPALDGDPTEITNITLTYTAATSAESITARLTDLELNTLCTDNVNNITVVGAAGPAPINVSPPAIYIASRLKIPTATPLSGTFDKTKGDEVVLLVESREKGSRHRSIVFVDPATVNVGAGTWSYGAPGIPAVYKGKSLLLILTLNGVVAGIVRSRLT